MPTATLPKLQQIDPQNRLLFLVYSFYRLGIATILLLLFFGDAGLGSESSRLYLLTTSIYLACNILLVVLFLNHWQPSPASLLLILASDIILLQLAAGASGLVKSGLGVLLVVSVAAGSIFLKRHQVLLVPAFATITLLINVSLNVVQGDSGDRDIVASGWLGITFFVTSITVQYLSARLQASEQLAQRESALAKKLERLSSLVIERMQTGIAVISHNGNIVLCNNAGRKLLGAKNNVTEKPLDIVNQAVAKQFNSWLQNTRSNDGSSLPLQSFVGGPKIKLSFIKISLEGESEYLLFIEDLSKITQHAQQLKLASLGQLTASIAHEIRNPLGAVSHAAQLLEESSASNEDRKLTQIISQQTKRCSGIIESVMSVSRGNASDIKQIDLACWLPPFLESYKIGKQSVIEFDTPETLMISFDTNQLGQILTNLLDNGSRYSAASTGIEKVCLRAGLDQENLPYLDIIDFGPGVNPGDTQHLFEPFFTTEKSGSGLGLYICRELCEANQARINYLANCLPLPEPPDNAQDATLDTQIDTTHTDTCMDTAHNNPRRQSTHCFRINFAHPDRKAFDTSKLAISEDT